PEEPVSETSPLLLAEASDRVLERLSAAIAGALDEATARAVTDALGVALEPAAIFALADELAAMVPGREGAVSFEGELEHVPLGEVLQLLTHQRQTGILEIEKHRSRSGRAVAVCMKEGRVDLALGRVEEQEFRLGRYLMREGLIEREDLERILEGRAQPGARRLLGAQLVKLGYVSSEE